MRLWPFGNGVSKLSKEILQELLEKFNINSDDAAEMRYVKKRGRISSGPVNLICIFNPALLSSSELSSANYNNLMALNKGLLFTGHIIKGTDFSGAVVILHDQRAA